MFPQISTQSPIMVVVCIVMEQDHPQCKLEKKKRISGGPDSAVQPGTEQQHHSEARTMQQGTVFVGFFSSKEIYNECVVKRKEKTE